MSICSIKPQEREDRGEPASGYIVQPLAAPETPASIICQDTPILLWDLGDDDYSFSMSEDSTTSTPLNTTAYSVQITASCNVCDIDYDAANGRFFVVYDAGSRSYKLKVIDKDVMKTATNLLDADGDEVALAQGNDYRYFTAGSAENNTYCAIFDDDWGWYEMRASTRESQAFSRFQM